MQAEDKSQIIKHQFCMSNCNSFFWFCTQNAINYTQTVDFQVHAADKTTIKSISDWDPSAPAMAGANRSEQFLNF